MRLLELLKMRGFDMTSRTKLLRHRSSQFDLETMFRRGYLNDYQSVQSSDVLRCDFVVSFFAQRHHLGMHSASPD